PSQSRPDGGYPCTSMTGSASPGSSKKLVVFPELVSIMNHFLAEGFVLRSCDLPLPPRQLERRADGAKEACWRLPGGRHPVSYRARSPEPTLHDPPRSAAVTGMARAAWSRPLQPVDAAMKPQPPDAN